MRVDNLTIAQARRLLKANDDSSRLYCLRHVCEELSFYLKGKRCKHTRRPFYKNNLGTYCHTCFKTMEDK